MLKIPQNSKLYSKITLKLYAFMYSYAFVLPANRTKPKAHISVAKFILPHLDLNYKANIYNITTKNKNVFRSLLFLFSSWFIMQRRLYWYDKCRQCSLRDSETCRKESSFCTCSMHSNKTMPSFDFSVCQPKIAAIHGTHRAVHADSKPCLTYCIFWKTLA